MIVMLSQSVSSTAYKACLHEVKSKEAGEESNARVVKQRNVLGSARLLLSDH